LIPIGKSSHATRTLENQLYRVEIHQPGVAWDGKADISTTKAATFKWSRENGSAIYPIVTLGGGSGTTAVTLETLGRDDRFGLAEGDWVEIVDDDCVLQNRYEILFKIQAIDRMTMVVTLNGAPPLAGQSPAKHPLLRRWDHKDGDPADGGLQLGSDGAALIVEGRGDTDNWLELEDGVMIQFQKPDAGQIPNQYRTGDYWLIPARTATGDVEWPLVKDSQGKLVSVAKAPDGVVHHYAPLAVIAVNADGIRVGKLPCRKNITRVTPLK
jgi:hypothetical protein